MQQRSIPIASKEVKSGIHPNLKKFSFGVYISAGLKEVWTIYVYLDQFFKLLHTITI